jgi:hypothetical protein
MIMNLKFNIQDSPYHPEISTLYLRFQLNYTKVQHLNKFLNTMSLPKKKDTPKNSNINTLIAKNPTQHTQYQKPGAVCTISKNPARRAAVPLFASVN